MQNKIDDVVKEHFIMESDDDARQAPRPFWPGRCGPLLKLKEGLRASIDGAQIDRVGLNDGCKAYFLFLGSRKVGNEDGIRLGSTVEFCLERPTDVPVIEAARHEE